MSWLKNEKNSYGIAQYGQYCRNVQIKMYELTELTQKTLDTLSPNHTNSIFPLITPTT